MPSSIYYSFIRGREGEINALHRLSPFACSRVAVVVDLPTVELPFGRSLEDHIGQFVSSLAAAWGGAPLYLDLTRYGPEQLDRRGRNIVEHLFDCARQTTINAIPVTGPLTERGPGTSYLEAVARIAARDQRGAALRLRYADFEDEATLVREITAGVASLSLPAPSVDLFLDVESVERLPAIEAAEPVLLRRALEALRVASRYSFRTIVFAGSSVPDPLPAHSGAEPLRIERREWRVWKQLARHRALTLPCFGDTGIWSPHQPDQGAGGGAPPARIRFPIGDEQVFFKAKAGDYRALARTAVDTADLSSLPRSWGLDCIRRTAIGSGAVASASGWVARDTNLHIETTVRQVQEFLQQIGRFQEMAPAVERKTPWQQETLLE